MGPSTEKNRTNVFTKKESHTKKTKKKKKNLSQSLSQPCIYIYICCDFLTIYVIYQIN